MNKLDFKKLLFYFINMIIIYSTSILMSEIITYITGCVTYRLILIKLMYCCC
jgi:hypothetical protein